jgi:hypothetical protein
MGKLRRARSVPIRNSDAFDGEHFDKDNIIRPTTASQINRTGERLDGRQLSDAVEGKGGEASIAGRDGLRVTFGSISSSRGE